MTLDTDLKFRRQNANYRELETSDKQILKFTVAEFTVVTVGSEPYFVGFGFVLSLE